MAHWNLEKIKSLIIEKGARDERRVTYEIIVAETGVSWPTLVRYANNKVTRPDPALIAKIARYFGVETAYFLDEDDAPAVAQQ